MCMYVLSVCICVHHMCAWYLWKSEKNGGFLGTRVMNDYEIPCGARN